jgi:uncharacterized heparinase superfamily protein
MFSRVWFKMYRPEVSINVISIRPYLGSIIDFEFRKQRMYKHNRFKFLNIEREIQTPSDWNNPEWEKLWLYNLHYFDDLRAEGWESRVGWHKELIERWIKENPPFSGNAWEPYTISRRLVNWVLWALSENVLSDDALKSLCIQSAYLNKRIEWHILGNHLMANAKALIFTGLFFEGKEADKWLEKGLKIFSQQLEEQVLPDGGHFELTPMYHAQVLEDVLNVINILQSYPNAGVAHRDELISHYSQISGKMLDWLKVMTHPDGGIVLFNDSAFGVSANAEELYRYAEKLKIKPFVNTKICNDDIRISHLRNSGYLRIENSEVTAFLDVAKIGPDYLPGHAHADTLNFEISIGKQRVIVDTGISHYESGKERLLQRGTAAHNTVVIDGADSSEVWGSFRVARRAYPFDLKIDKKNEITCSHNGYTRLSGKPVHNRKWVFLKNSLKIKDNIYGTFNEAVSYIHVHPDVKVNVSHESHSKGTFVLADGRQINWTVDGGNVNVIDTAYHPEFGVTVPNRCLEIKLIERELDFEIIWQ